MNGKERWRRLGLARGALGAAGAKCVVVDDRDAPMVMLVLFGEVPPLLRKQMLAAAMGVVRRWPGWCGEWHRRNDVA